MNKVIIISGATATGKTSLSISLGKLNKLSQEVGQLFCNETLS